MRSAIAALLLAALPAAASAVVDPDLAAVFSDPEFKKRFLGTYGIHPDIEPKMNSEERTVLEKTYPLLGSDPEAAAKQLEAAATPEATALFDFILGNVAVQQDRTEEAIARYRTAVTKFPSFRRAFRNLGLAQVRAGAYEEAIESFTRMIELGGGDGLSYGLLGYAYAAKNDPLAAEAAYRTALLLDPKNGEWRLGLARAVVKQEKFEEAAALLRTLLERSPDRSEFWLLQANAYLGMKQPLRAAENLEVVARMDKATTDTMNLLGDLYLNENRPDLAAAAYARAIDFGPNQAGTRPLRNAEALAARGAGAEARLVAERIASVLGDRLAEDERKSLMRLNARVAVAEGDDEAATRILEEIVSVDPLDGDALLLLGQHHARAGDNEKAMVYFERAANLEAFEGPAKVRMAQIQVGRGRYPEAIALLKRSQEIRPQDELARYIEQLERVARTQR